MSEDGTVRFATAHKNDGVDVDMLRRRLEAWIADVQKEPPEHQQECTFTVIAYPRELQSAKGPGFAVEVARASWRNS